MPKLLLADDSVTIQRVIELTFSGEDVQVITAGDGEEAIARIPSERPDIILADIGMPKRSGYDVSAFVKSHPELAHIPVLLLAGAFEPVDQARAEQVRCDGVLVKPFEPQQVIARVRELVEGAKGTPTRATAGVPRPIERLAPPVSREVKPEPETRRVTPEPRRPETDVRVVTPRQPIVEMPESTPAAGVSDSLDDYFDRLDAAFASLGNGTGAPAPAPSPVLDELAAHVDVPTIDDLLGVPMVPVPGDQPPAGVRISAPPVEPPESPATLTPSPRAAAEGEQKSADASHSVISDVFSALLAVEQGDAAAAMKLPRSQARPVITDELVDDVTRRVLERLAPAAARDVVARIVSEVAERLVREEIARLRALDPGSQS